MRSYFSYLLYTSLFIFILFQGPFIQAKNEIETSTLIDSFAEDLTGDGFRENFTLNGILLSSKSGFYRDVWLDITSPFSHQWKISFDGGYEPKLDLIDLNHDHTFDIFYQVAKNENKSQYSYQLYTLKNGLVKQLPLPKHNHIQAKYLQDFKVEIRIDPNQKPIIKDISKLKKQYVNDKIYDGSGKLLKKEKATINPISTFEPILISESKGYGLKSSQSIKGINDHDVFGEIVTLWYYKNDEWIILKSEWIEK